MVAQECVEVHRLMISRERDPINRNFEIVHVNIVDDVMKVGFEAGNAGQFEKGKADSFTNKQMNITLRQETKVNLMLGSVTFQD